MQALSSKEFAAAGRVAVDESLVTKFSHHGWVKMNRLLDETDLKRVRVIAKEMSANQTTVRKVGRDGYGQDANNDDYIKRLRVLNIRDSYPEIVDIAAKIAPIAAALLEVRSLRLWSDMLFIKQGRDAGSKPTMWHQDLPKIPIDRRGMINAWIAVDDVPVSRGAMAFASGSHRIGSLGAISQLGEDRDLTELLSNRDWDFISGLHTVPLLAGEATFHNGMTLHRAHANKDQADRVGLGFHMIDSEALYTGAASRYTDGSGMKAFGLFDDQAFPIIY